MEKWDKKVSCGEGLGFLDSEPYCWLWSLGTKAS